MFLYYQGNYRCVTSSIIHDKKIKYSNNKKMWQQQIQYDKNKYNMLNNYFFLVLFCKFKYYYYSYVFFLYFFKPGTKNKKCGNFGGDLIKQELQNKLQQDSKLLLSGNKFLCISGQLPSSSTVIHNPGSMILPHWAGAGCPLR